MAADPALVVMAKAPVPGRVKTRLCPPCTPEQAARVASAALADTLAAAARARAGRRVLALDGDPAAVDAHGFEVILQRGADLGARLGAVVGDVGAPLLVVGMDCPEVTAELLDRGLAALAAPGVDAVLGPAADGGYWAIGLAQARPEAFAGVPMSRPDTGARQRERLEELGLAVAELPRLADLDRFEDLAVAPAGSRLAAVRDELAGELEGSARR